MINHNLHLSRCKSMLPMNNICIRGKEGSGRSSLALDIAHDLRAQSKVDIEIIADDSFGLYSKEAKELGGLFTTSYCINFAGQFNNIYSIVENRHNLCREHGWTHIRAYDKGKLLQEAAHPHVTIIDCCYSDTDLSIESTLDILHNWNMLATETSCYYIIITNNPKIFAMAPIRFQTIKTHNPDNLQALRIKDTYVCETIQFELHTDSPRH